MSITISVGKLRSQIIEDNKKQRQWPRNNKVSWNLKTHSQWCTPLVGHTFYASPSFQQLGSNYWNVQTVEDIWFK